MLRRIKISNYRAFERFEASLENRNLFIGPNNAGKSTLVSALRLIAHFTRTGQLRRFTVVIPGVLGVPVDLDSLGVSRVNLPHNYRDKPSRITAIFDDSLRLEIEMNATGACYGRWYHDDSPVNRPELVRRTLGTSIGVVPTVGPLDIDEALLKADYVRRNLDSPLSPRHFRNQWYHFPDGWWVFHDLVAETLPGIEVYRPEVRMLTGQTLLSMDFREGKFAADVACAGHGMQVWLQLLSHLTRLRDRRTVVLDEPDVYLHPDLQRKVVELVDSLGLQQFIVASHSVDILNEFDPDQVIHVDRTRTRARRLDSLEDVQGVTSALGSSLNSYFAKLARSRVCLFVEGTDFETLRRLGALGGHKEFAQQRGFAVVPIEGSDNWQRLLHMNWLMENFTGEHIRAFLALDRDYRCQQELDEISAQLAGKGVRCHFWARKEIENYLLAPRAIASATRAGESGRRPRPEDVLEILRACAEELRSTVVAEKIAQETRYRRAEGVSTATIGKAVLERLSREWETGSLKLAGGKDILTGMRRALSELGFRPPTNVAIIRELRPDEVDQEVVDFCHVVEHAARAGMERTARSVR